MKRREIIKYAALLSGAAVSAPLAMSLLSGCQTDAVSNADKGNLNFFNPEEFSFVEMLVDLILPKTDSPSATEVGVHHTIDAMVGTVYQPEERDNYRKKFDSLYQHLSKIKFQEKGFTQKSRLIKLKLVEERKDEVGDAFKALKQQTVAYYLSTEEIGTKFLNYLPVPGNYEACISLEEAGGKLWTL